MNCSWHSNVMIGMRSIIEGGQGKIDWTILFERVSSKCLGNLTHHESIQARDSMAAMVLRTSYGDNGNVILDVHGLEIMNPVEFEKANISIEN